MLLARHLPNLRRQVDEKLGCVALFFYYRNLQFERRKENQVMLYLSLNGVILMTKPGKTSSGS